MTIAIIAATAFQAYSSYQQGVDARDQARSQAAMAEYNAKVARQQAEAERRNAEEAAKQHQRKASQIMARNRALVGKSGVAETGSPLLVMEDTANQLEMERGRILAAGYSRAGAYENQSILDTMSAKSYKQQGSNAYKSGLIGAGSSALSGYGDYKYKQSLLNN